MDTEFAYWIPNVSGGLVVSDWEMDTDWTYEYNRDLAQTAEEVGFRLLWLSYRRGERLRDR